MLIRATIEADTVPMNMPNNVSPPNISARVVTRPGMLIVSGLPPIGSPPIKLKTLNHIASPSWGKDVSGPPSKT